MPKNSIMVLPCTFIICSFMHQVTPDFTWWYIYIPIIYVYKINIYRISTCSTDEKYIESLFTVLVLDLAKEEFNLALPIYSNRLPWQRPSHRWALLNHLSWPRRSLDRTAPPARRRSRRGWERWRWCCPMGWNRMTVPVRQPVQERDG